MSSKQIKKNKKKLIKLKQKEITARNKELQRDPHNKIELLALNESGLPDIEDKIERSGPRGYVLKILKDMVDDLNSEIVDDKEILLIAKFLIEFAETPKSTYDELLKVANINLSSDEKKLMNKANVNLNITERALIKNRMQGILMEYTSNDLNTTNIDYSGIRVFFEITYRLILVGLEDKKIKSISTYLGYGDVISDLIVEYSDDNSKYNIKNTTFINVTWNPLDNLYNTYSIYKNKYKNFSQSSLQSLATATAMAKEYESREQGKEIVSYNGIILNYICVLEFELKELISRKFNLNKKKLKLIDAINYLSEINNPVLSNKEFIDDLHKIRLLRNKVAHGESITQEEFLYIKDILLSRKTLEYINKEFVSKDKRYANQGDANAQFNLGFMYYTGDGVKQDYKEAIKWFTKSANQGNVNAQINLGAMYEEGIGVKKNYQEAIKWITRAANQGDTEAQTLLGARYYNGFGVKQDYKEAVKWYIKAANQGDIQAQILLGSMYYRGSEIKQDYKEAIKWYTTAANQGDIMAQSILGGIYDIGEAVKQDYQEAIKWYTMAANQGHVDSQTILGIIYVAGEVVKQDYEEAIKWYTMAANQGHEKAQTLLRKLNRKIENENSLC